MSWRIYETISEPYFSLSIMKSRSFTNFQSLKSNQRGQAAVEYLIVCFCLIATLLTVPSIYLTFSDAVSNKYKSYCFGVAISDPPTKAFDDKEKAASDALREVKEVFNAIEQLIKDLFFPEPDGSMPAIDAVKKFINTLKNIF